MSVMELAAVLLRGVAFAASVVLFGTPLFLQYSLPGDVRAPALRGLLAAAAGLVLLAAAAALGVQTAVMVDDPGAALDPAILRSVLTGGGFGTSVVVRAAAGLAALILTLTVRPVRAMWACAWLAGAPALAALAWGGHGAAGTGLLGGLHTLGDLIHLLAAGMWLGALTAFAILLSPAQAGAEAAVLHRALQGFSGIGSLLVAAILVTGIANSVALAGAALAPGLVGTGWGRLLMAKVLLFAVMLGLAARNRYRLTPQLAAALDAGPREMRALQALRRSVLAETAAGAAVLILVAVLGVLPPPGEG